MRIAYDNLIDEATLTSDNENANYPLSALKDIHLSNTFRFDSLDGGYIDFDLGSAKDVSCVGIISNISSVATITLKGNSSESWSSPPLEETITAVNRNILEYFSSVTYRYYRLEIDDPTNPDGYIEVARVFLGTYESFPSPSPDYTRETEDLSSRQFSPSGQPFTVVRPQRLRLSLSFPPVFSNITRDSMLAIYAANGVGVPMFVDLWEEDFTTEDPLYMLIEANSSSFTKFNRGTLWSLDLTFLEAR